jgi:hypothetical protein
MAPNSTIDFIVAQGAASTSVVAHSCSPKIVRDSWGSEIQRHSLISCSRSLELYTPMFQFDGEVAAPEGFHPEEPGRKLQKENINLNGPVHFSSIPSSGR